MNIGKSIYWKSFLWTAISLLLIGDSFNFLIGNYSHIQLYTGWLGGFRDLLVVLTAGGFMFFILQNSPIRKPELLQSLWKGLLAMAVLLLLAFLFNYQFSDVGFHRTGELVAASDLNGLTDTPDDDGLPETEDPAPVPVGSINLRPTTFFSIIYSFFMAGGFLFFSAFAWVHIRNYVFHKRTRRFETNFYILLSLLVVMGLRSLVPAGSFLSGEVLQVLLLLAFGVYALLNGFRLSWVLYVTRREKIISVFLLSLVITLTIIFLTTDLLGAMQAMEYLSPFILTVVRFTITFILGYSAIAFFSILFHLPTSEAFEKKSTELTSLHSLSRLISSVFDIRELSEAVVNFSVQTTNADSAWLETYSTQPNGQREVKLLSPKNITSTDIQILTGMNGSSIREALVSTRTLLNIQKANTHPLMDQVLVKKKKIGSLIAVPLIARDNLVGGLFVAKGIEFGFDREDVDTVLTFAEQAAIAIDNTRLFEMSLEKERLQQELFIAQNIQMKLLPQSNPDLPHAEVESVSYPAYEVGGDYYDFLSLPDGKTGIVVADVSGKGTSAAFYMAEVKGIFQSLARNFPEPKALLAEANHVLFNSLERKSFVSVLYAVYDPIRSEVVTSRAGHCPLLRIRADGSTEFIRSKGIGLGMGPSTVFSETTEEVRLSVQPGDVLVMYSDGVVEAMNEMQEEFGYERLEQICRDNRMHTAREILDQIISGVNAFIWNGRANDDLTLVVTKWKGTE